MYIEPQSIQLAELSWPRIRAKLQAGHRRVVFAAASTEQHGPHLPLATDTIIGDYLADRVAVSLGDALMAPTIHIGESTHHMTFPGTISVDKSLFLEEVRAYVLSLAAHGFDEIYVIASHGGNFAPLAELLDETDGRVGDARLFIYCDLKDFVRCLTETGEREGISPGINGGHAGESETSILLALRPDLVHMSDAVAGRTEPIDEAAIEQLMTQGMRGMSEHGVLGDARPATAERGQRYLDGLVETIMKSFMARS